MAKKFTILKDTREHQGKGWMFRASANCKGMVRQKLDVGDYTIDGLEKVIAVERKTLGDLWNTLGRQDNYQRFLREWERAEGYRMKYLVIEATLAEVDRGYRYSKVPPANIHAKLISLQVKYNVHVIFAGREDKARGWVRKLFAKIHKYRNEGII